MWEPTEPCPRSSRSWRALTSSGDFRCCRFSRSSGPAPLSDCRTRHGFRRATPEVTDPGPRAVHEQGLLAAEHSVGPQTGQCPDPGSTIADFERWDTGLLECVKPQPRGARRGPGVW